MDKKWVILICFVVFYFLGMIGVAWATYESVDPDSSNAFLATTKVVLLMFGGLGVILPTYINIWNSVESSKAQEQQDNLKKADNAFDLLRKWDDDALLSARKLTRNLTG